MAAEISATSELNVLQLIQQRSSTKKFAEDPIPKQDIESLLAAAVRAPDHGMLAPWRFIVLQGEARGVLARAMQQAFVARNPEASAEMLEREASKAWRSPLLIVTIARFKPHPKVPEAEQLLATGAAVQNLWLAAAAHGLGLAWKTGSHAYAAEVRAALSVDSSEQIVGFLHIGKSIAKNQARPADFASCTTWL